MADDRPELNEAAAEWDDDREPTPEEQAEEDAWIAENHDWIKAKIDEALNDPRPALTMEEVEARAQVRYARLREKYGDC